MRDQAIHGNDELTETVIFMQDTTANYNQSINKV